jgi:hypothetical protein
MYAWREKHGVRLVSLDETVVTSEELDADANLGPVTSFEALEEEFGLEPRLVSAATGNFANPTPIQASTWPILLGGKDVIGVAHTGSGKSVRRLATLTTTRAAQRACCLASSWDSRILNASRFSFFHDSVLSLRLHSFCLPSSSSCSYASAMRVKRPLLHPLRQLTTQPPLPLP